MSDYERNKGKLVPIKLSEEIAKQLIFKKNGYHVLSDYCDTYFEQVMDDPEDYGLCVIENRFYQITWEIEHDTDCFDFADVKVNEDGSINFHTLHYNGGVHWTEMIEEALK